MSKNHDTKILKPSKDDHHGIRDLVSYTNIVEKKYDLYSVVSSVERPDSYDYFLPSF